MLGHHLLNLYLFSSCFLSRRKKLLKPDLIPDHFRSIFSRRLWTRFSHSLRSEMSSVKMSLSRWSVPFRVLVNFPANFCGKLASSLFSASRKRVLSKSSFISRPLSWTNLERTEIWKRINKLFCRLSIKRFQSNYIGLCIKRRLKTRVATSHIKINCFHAKLNSSYLIGRLLWQNVRAEFLHLL